MSEKRILVTGAKGFVGSRIMEQFKTAVASPSLRDCNEEEIRRIIEESGAEVILHTAAISDTGVCQKYPEESYRANVELPLMLAKAAAGRKLICFSSDQVYNGADVEGPFTESDAKPAPNSVYANHKLEMEKRVLGILPDAVMLRAEWMYDFVSPKGNYYLNVVKAKGSVAFSSGQYRGVTYVREVAENMERVFELPGGAYNYGSETNKSIHQITKEFVAAADLKIDVLDAPARFNLWMNCDKARAFGVNFSDVSDGLMRCWQESKI